MFGPGLEELDNSLVQKMMTCPEILLVAGLPHRQIHGNDGFGFWPSYFVNRYNTKNLGEEVKKRNYFSVSLKFSRIMVKEIHYLCALFRRINAVNIWDELIASVNLWLNLHIVRRIILLFVLLFSCKIPCYSCCCNWYMQTGLSFSTTYNKWLKNTFVILHRNSRLILTWFSILISNYVNFT